MTRRSSTGTTARRLKQGRGQGEGDNYKPYLTTRDVSSVGMTSNIPTKSGLRSEQVMSRLEKGYALFLRRRSDVISTKEQMPLLPIEETDAIARSLKIRPFRDPWRQPYVLTTDFLVEYQDGRSVGVFVKPLKLFCTLQREREKARVEREYWSRRATEFRIVTETQLPGAMIDNLEILNGHRRPPAGFSDDKREEVGVRVLQEQLSKAADKALFEVCLAADVRYGLATGSHLSLLLHLISRGSLSMNLQALLCTEQPYWIDGTCLKPVARRS